MEHFIIFHLRKILFVEQVKNNDEQRAKNIDKIAQISKKKALKIPQLN